MLSAWTLCMGVVPRPGWQWKREHLAWKGRSQLTSGPWKANSVSTHIFSQVVSQSLLPSAHILSLSNMEVWIQPHFLASLSILCTHWVMHYCQNLGIHRCLPCISSPHSDTSLSWLHIQFLLDKTFTFRMVFMAKQSIIFMNGGLAGCLMQSRHKTLVALNFMDSL